MTKDEEILYNRLLKIIEKANKRLLRLEKLTGKKESFASKQLFDYLNASNIQAITKSDRISLKKSYKLNQLKAIEKATEDFLKESTSTISGAKKYKNYIEQLVGKKLSWSSVNKIYVASDNYEWIYNYYDSDIWDIARESKEQNWSFNTFLNTVIQGNSSLFNDFSENKKDVELQINIFYDYIMKE